MKPSLLQILPDLYQVQLPLPFALRIVNCYLLRDQNRWSIIDTGLNIPDARQTWLAAFRELNISPGQIQQIILTHYHPDHYGLAGWLQQLSGNPELAPPAVLMSERGAELANEIWRHKSSQVGILRQFFTNCGAPESLAQNLTMDIQKLHTLIEPQPQKIKILAPGTNLKIGMYHFQIIHTPGHSDGHLIFYDATQKLVICGDHILLNITPNISQWPNTEEDPLGRYLKSLHRLAHLSIKTALPGHGPNIEHWQSRLHELKIHHDERLAIMLARVNASTTIFEVCRKVFDLDMLSFHEIRFAIAETRAHLEYLVQSGEIRREENGFWWYRRSQSV